MNCGCQAPYIGPSVANTCYGGSFVLFMSILDILIRNKCDLSEICKRVTPKQQPDAEYDFVVIGGGAGGSVVAGRLSEIPEWKVLLIEAGGDEPPGTQVPSFVSNFIGQPDVDWGYKTEPQDNACLGYPERRCRWPRGKVLGGCGTINGMMYIRGVPKDYDNWGVEGWGYEEVLPYFKKSERNLEVGRLVKADLHGTEGVMRISRFPDHPEIADDVLKAAKELNFSVVDDLNGALTGFTIAQMSHINASRQSSARAFLRPARNRSNLHIMLNSTATKIILNNKKVSHVEFQYQNRSFSVRVKREVIVSAGVINSPQILLLSGIGPKDQLDKVQIQQTHNLPGVGKNLHNHVSFMLYFELKSRKAINDLDWLAVYDYLTFRRGNMASTGLDQLTGRLGSKYSNFSRDFPDLQFFWYGYTAGCSHFGGVGEPEDLKSCHARKKVQISTVNIHPRSRGYIGLKSKDPLVAPTMDPKYLSDPQDAKVLVEGIRFIQKFANTTVFKRNYGIEPLKNSYGNCSELHSYDSDDFWICAMRYQTNPENHQAGSCKMGSSSDPLAVVDSKLKVHGIGGLRVMDASIMPVVVSGNLHATVVMIAEKGAEFVKKEWLGK